MSTEDRNVSTEDDASTPTRDGRELSRHEVRQVRSEQLKRALALTGLSTIWPGIGLLRTRRKWLGVVLALGAAVTAIVLGFVLFSGGVLAGAAKFATKRGLISLLVLVAIGALVWISGILLTAKETSGRRWTSKMRWALRGFTTLMVLIVAVPAVQAVRYVTVTRSAFDKIFTDRYEGRGGPARGPGAGSDPWKSVPRVNMLLLGSDAGTDRYKQRTDSMMVVSIDTKTGDTTLISIPRNLQKVPFPKNNPMHALFPKGYDCPERGGAGAECMMNGVWIEADNNKDKFPADEANPGLDTTREVIGEIVGLHIDYTAVIDMSGFQQLVDAMGGVYITVPGPPPGIPIGGKVVNGYVVPGSITGYIAPGYQKLNGRNALWYARSRVAGTDDDRMRRQRCMVNALVSQTDPFQMVTKFTGIMEAAGQNIRLDVPQDELPAFAELVDRMKSGNSRTVNVTDSVKHYNPDFAKIRSMVKTAINTPHDPKAPKAGATASTSSPTSSSSPTTSSPTTEPSSKSTSVKPVTDTAEHC